MDTQQTQNLRVEPETLKLPLEVIDAIKGMTQTTSRLSSDPGRLVVNRQKVFAHLQEHWGLPITPKVANQLVTLASRKIPRQPLTIDSASRYKYLLAEVQEGRRWPPCLLVLDYLWDKPELHSQATEAYRIAALQGLRAVIGD